MEKTNDLIPKTALVITGGYCNVEAANVNFPWTRI